MNLWRNLHVLLPRLLPADYSLFEEFRRHILHIIACLAEPLHHNLGFPLGHRIVKDGVLYLVSIVEFHFTNRELLGSLIKWRQTIDIHIDSKTRIGKLDLVDKTKRLKEVGVLRLWVEGLGDVSWPAFLLLILISGGLRSLLLSVPDGIIGVRFIYLLSLLLLLLRQLVGHPQCQDSLLDQVALAPHFDDNSLGNLSLLTPDEGEGSLEELFLFQGLDVELQVYQLHQAV